MSKPESITSAANPLLKDVRRAIVRGTLTNEGWCVAETFHLLEEALRSDCEVKIVLVAESVRSAAESHVRRLAGVKVVVLPDALLQRLSGTESSQGVMALVKPPVWKLEQLFRGRAAGGGSRRLAGPRQRRRHRARGRSLRRHRHSVPQRHRQPVESQNPARLGRFAVSRPLPARRGRHPGARRPPAEQGGTVCGRARAHRRCGSLRRGDRPDGALRLDRRQRSARRQRRNCARPRSTSPFPPSASNPSTPPWRPASCCTRRGAKGPYGREPVRFHSARSRRGRPRFR